MRFPPDPDLPDAELIERSWHDPEAFAGLYDREPRTTIAAETSSCVAEEAPRAL
jgi:hypothetical protein